MGAKGGGQKSADQEVDRPGTGPSRRLLPRVTSLLALEGVLRRIGCIPGVAPSYKYKERGENEKHTPHTTPSPLLSSHLSESSLREFRSRDTQEGRWQRRSSPNCTSMRVREIVGGCAGLVGALLRLYLDGCLFGCKCSRLSLFVI